MERDPDSHKGDNGTVAVIGGSRHMHGAPILSALAAEKSGCDLVYLALPQCHEEAAKSSSCNFQVHPFAGDNPEEQDLEYILELLAVMDCAVIGPGIALHERSLNVIQEIVDGAACPLVLDAAALQKFALNDAYAAETVLTPHLGELERMGILPSELSEAAMRVNATIFLKGSTDTIASPDGDQYVINGGNAGLTVGGTGDALAGLIAGLMAQRMSSSEACRMAGATMKKAGEKLFEEKGFAYSARDVIELIPSLLAHHD